MPPIDDEAKDAFEILESTIWEGVPFKNDRWWDNFVVVEGFLIVGLALFVVIVLLLFINKSFPWLFLEGFILKKKF